MKYPLDREYLRNVICYNVAGQNHTFSDDSNDGTNRRRASKLTWVKIKWQLFLFVHISFFMALHQATNSTNITVSRRGIKKKTKKNNMADYLDE